MSARAWAPAAAFVSASLVAGACNYLFQVRAATRLELAAFGDFSRWFAWVGVGLVLGGSAQFYANFRPAGARARAGAFAFAAAILLATAALSPLGFDLRDRWLLGAVTVAACASFGYLYGQLQAHKLFGLLAVAQVSWAGVRVAFAFLPGHGERLLANFLFATAFAYGAGSVVVWLGSAVVPALRERLAADAAVRPSAAGLGASLYLAGCAAIFPNLDLLALGGTRADSDLGAFNRCLLFARAIYFAGSIALQLLLPYQLRPPAGRWHELLARRGTVVVAGACGAAAAATVLVGPWVARNLLGYSVDPYRGWLAAMCLNIALLLVAQMVVQRGLAAGTTSRTWVLFAALFAVLYAVNVTSGLSIGGYLVASVALHALATAGVLAWEKRARLGAARLSAARTP